MKYANKVDLFISCNNEVLMVHSVKSEILKLFNKNIITYILPINLSSSLMQQQH